MVLVKTTYSQNKTIEISGIVKYDSMNLQDINIINLTSKLGTYSNFNGKFLIPVKIGDSLLFSSIVYKPRTIKITENHIASKKITVYLEADLNELDEVQIRKNPIIDWQKAAVTKGTIYNNDSNTKAKPPNAETFTNPINGKFGIDFISLFSAITKKGRLKRKAKRQEENHIQFLKNDFSNKIKNTYETEFFTQWLNISEDKIYLFLDYCEANGLNNLYNSDEIIIKNFLIKQSNSFNKIKN